MSKHSWELEQAELERARSELRAKVTHEQAALNELLSEAEGWRQAKAIRAYVGAVKALAKRERTMAEHAEWIAWAFDQADRLDPLCISPPSILDTPRDRYRKLGPYEIENEDGSIERIWG